MGPYSVEQSKVLFFLWATKPRLIFAFQEKLLIFFMYFIKDIKIGKYWLPHISYSIIFWIGKVVGGVVFFLYEKNKFPLRYDQLLYVWSCVVVLKTGGDYCILMLYLEFVLKFTCHVWVN